MKKRLQRLRVRDLEVERLVLRAPGGQVRAMLESKSGKQGAAPRVSLVLFAPDGEPAIVATVSRNGRPRISVGHPDRSPTVILSPEGLDAWSAGNVAASIRAEDGRGIVEVEKAPRLPRSGRRRRG